MMVVSGSSLASVVISAKVISLVVIVTLFLCTLEPTECCDRRRCIFASWLALAYFKLGVIALYCEGGWKISNSPFISNLIKVGFRLFTPSLMKSWVTHILGAVPENCVAIKKSIHFISITIFIARIYQVTLQAPYHFFILLTS